jgi:DNA-binding LytR/AlgR family response regulator
MRSKPFFVWYEKVLKSIDPEQVVCLVTEGNYTKIFLADNTYYMVRTSLAGALKKLPPDVFIRVHRSVAASVFYIDNIDRDHLIIQGQSLPVARRYYRSAINQLNIID